MDSRLKNSGKKGIRRHTYEGMEGWFVRYMREGAMFRKVFSDRDHGGPDGSFAAAEKFHSQLISYFPPKTRREHAEQRRRNSHDIIGVRRVTKVVKGYAYDFWQASYTPAGGGPHTHRLFSVHKYGEEEAKRMAIETRKKALAEYGDSFALNYDDDFVWVVPEGEIAIAANVDSEGVEEGAISLEQHRKRERSRELRAAKIADFAARHGRIFCEVCGFDFERCYGVLGAGLIEVHHIKAIADYTPLSVTELEDLILVCSNCHYVIHRDANYERNFRQLKEVIALRNILEEKKGRPTRRYRQPR